jgi:hypothetical protein
MRAEMRVCCSVKSRRSLRSFSSSTRTVSKRVSDFVLSSMGFAESGGRRRRMSASEGYGEAFLGGTRTFRKRAAFCICQMGRDMWQEGEKSEAVSSGRGFFPGRPCETCRTRGGHTHSPELRFS